MLYMVVNDPVFESMLSNPEQITFTVLFVALLVYVMKTNDVREKQYRETITQLTSSLASLKDIEEKVDNLSTFIYKRGNTVKTKSGG